MQFLLHQNSQWKSQMSTGGDFVMVILQGFEHLWKLLQYCGDNVTASLQSEAWQKSREKLCKQALIKALRHSLWSHVAFPFRVWLTCEFGGFDLQAFGIGAFEEADDNIYAVDHMSNYDIELGADTNTGLHGWTGPPKENARGLCYMTC